MKFSSNLLKKVNGDPLISSGVSTNEVNSIVSGMIQNQLISGETINNLKQTIQENSISIQNLNELSGMLTFKD